MSFYTNKNVLVTGAAGLIGHSIVNRLLSEGAFVKATKHVRDIKIKHNNLRVLNCDLFNTENCESIVDDIDIVINSAAYVFGIGGQQSDPVGLVKNNLIPTVNLVDSVIRHKIPVFVNLGSSTMYPNVTYPVTEEEGFSGEPFKGYAGIGLVKRFLEKSFMHYNDISSTKFVLVRSTAVYGPHDNFTPTKAHVIPDTIIKAVKQTNPFVVWGDGSAVRDFIYVDDFVDGMLLAVEKGVYVNPINIATGIKTSVKDLVETTTKLCGYSPEIVYDTTKPTAIPVRLVSVEKAKSVLNWTYSTSLEEGLTKTINWYKNNI